MISNLHLSPQLGAKLIQAASQVMELTLQNPQPPDCESLATLADLPTISVAGVFVTLKRDGQLRGCFGNFGGQSSLSSALGQASIGVVTRDTRFPKFRLDDLDGLAIDVTVLHSYEEVAGPPQDRDQQIEIGRHGLMLRFGTQSGLLLPQVPVEHQWDASVFLQHLCRKAGVSEKAWRDADSQLFRFEGTIVSGAYCSQAKFAELSRRRTAAVAGKFYPGTEDAIQSALQNMMKPTQETRPVTAVMVPHAGWHYSGNLAAQSLAAVKIPETVLVLCPRHTRYGAHHAVMPLAGWELPGVTIDNNVELAHHLVDTIPGFSADAEAHAQEHAIEVLLPIIRACSPTVRVTGVVLGDADLVECLQLGRLLANSIRTFDEIPLLVISSDMNHFATDKENRRLDAIALHALESLCPSELYQTVVVQHQISMCGVRPAVIGLQAWQDLGLINSFRQIGYHTSADRGGDPTRVVGYAGYQFGLQSALGLDFTCP